MFQTHWTLLGPRSPCPSPQGPFPALVGHLSGVSSSPSSGKGSPGQSPPLSPSAQLTRAGLVNTLPSRLRSLCSGTSHPCCLAQSKCSLTNCRVNGGGERDLRAGTGPWRGVWVRRAPRSSPHSPWAASCGEPARHMRRKAVRKALPHDRKSNQSLWSAPQRQASTL